MSRFNLTLPSNSSVEYYPDNTTARFSTKLKSRIDLEGVWEVGLVEISFPSDVESVVDAECYYDIRLDNANVFRVMLRPQHFGRMRELVRDLHDRQREAIVSILDSLLVDDDVFLAEFEYDNLGKRINMRLQPRVAAKFSPDLARLLGFEPHVWYSRARTTAKQAPTFLGNVRSVYVYCDLLEHVPVGDTKAPLLRIVDKYERVHGNVHRVSNPVLYVPLQKKNFDTVEIRMTTDTGVTVPFLPGKSFVVLEFRRVVHSYFTI